METDPKESTQDASSSKKRKVSVEADSSGSKTNSTPLPAALSHGMSHTAAAAAAADDKNAYNQNLIANMMLRYTEETRQKKQKLHAFHVFTPAEHQKFQVPAMLIAQGQNSGPLTSTSTSVDQNRESSSSLFPTSSDTSNQSKTVIVSDTIAETTAPLDVLFGRRTRQRNNPGNIRLRQLCFTFYDEYKGGSRKQKTALTWRIFHEIHLEGGRFLKFNAITNAWIEVDNNTAREKVATVIREKSLSTFE